MSIDFQRAEFADATPAAAVCTACSQPIVQSYYEIAGKIICSLCRETRDRALDGSGFVRFLRAAFAGIGVGAVGALIWWGVRVLTDYELGIISIFIGYGVGKAVAWGSHSKGGWFYQLLALFLTYTAIVANYVPDIVQVARTEAPGAPAVLLYPLAFAISYAAPIMAGFENVIGILIIAFGLFEAWKLNKRADAAITGPYSVTPAAAPLPANV
jgi:hypothetical protein